MKNSGVALPGGLTKVALWSSLVDSGQQQLAYDGRRSQLDGCLTFVVYHRHIGALTDQQLYHLYEIQYTNYTSLSRTLHTTQ